MGRPRLIILLRHGESESNCDKSVNRTVPNHKVPLTARGHTQAKAAGRQLKEILLPGENVLIYTSPYRRTRETTQEIVSQLQDVEYRVYEEPRLREQDFGNFQNDEDEMARIWKERARYGHFFYRIPNGESAADVYDRCAGFNETLFRQFNSDKFAKVLVLVTHGLMTRVFLMKWYRWTVEKFEILKNVNYCEFVTMERQDDTGKYLLKTKMRTWNDTSPDSSSLLPPGSDDSNIDAKDNRIRLMYEQIKAAEESKSETASVAAAAQAAGKQVERELEELFKEDFTVVSQFDADRYQEQLNLDFEEAAENGICLPKSRVDAK
ncbi:histidine phosphatase superfamily [Lipomyces japonicus]|uniref:histidine phosphatase superfamily n=1 Tax=Lipomyces japonicus TaxID=56871 RepID=UPI0034CE326D